MEKKNGPINQKEKKSSDNWIYLDFCLGRQALPLGTHTCLVYRNQKRKNRIILQFIADGLQKGEQVVCITDSLTKEAILDWLKKKEIHISAADLERKLVVQSTKSMYYPNGYFSPEETMEKWRRLTMESPVEGLRVTGEVNWLSSDLPGAERFIEYEFMADEFFKNNFTTVVCQFDVNSLHGATLMEIIHMHPMLIVNGQIMHNPFYYSSARKQRAFPFRGRRKMLRQTKQQAGTLLLAVTGILETLPTLQRKAEFTEGLLHSVLEIKKSHLCLPGYRSQSFISKECQECKAQRKAEDYLAYSCPLIDRPNFATYAIKTADFCFGYLVLSEKEVYNNSLLMALVFNYINLLAISLENSIRRNQLQQNEKRIKAIMEGTDEGLWEYDFSTGRLEFDDNWQRILEYKPGEIEYNLRWLEENIHPDHYSHLGQALDDYLQKKTKYCDVEYKIKTKSGKWKWVWSRGIALTYDENNKPLKLTGTNRDITLYRQTREALEASVKQLALEKERANLLKMQKLESLGILAGGIAHDFNNLLSVILSNLQLAEYKLAKGQDATKDLKTVEKGTLRAAKLTKQLLAFSKGGAPVKQTVVLHEIIKETAEFALKGTPIKIEYFLPPDLWSVEIDTGQICQVLHNLLLNAYQAMPGGGVVKISAHNEILPPGNGMMLKPGNYVKVMVKDQGIGIPEENLGKIFDPYFTTKKQGSGLGLASSYYIIKNHGGYIGVSSQVGHGSVFYIYLPSSQKKFEPKAGTTKLRTEEKGRRILLMDDEPLLRNSVKEFLEACGHQVQEAAEGKEAVTLYKKSREMNAPFDVVIMDLTIPGGMGGKEAAGQILSMDPKAKIIVSSGYSNDPVLAEHVEYGFCDVITKPFSLEELHEKIVRVLSQEKSW
ncbi:MAG TPA: response regulator [Firmicutes bacterium]|nr:response regulator [Bacillota bacterium]